MSGGFGLEYDALGQGHEGWTRLGALMATTGSDLDGADTGGLAPGVRHAAATFLTAWSGYATESAAICDGLAGALRRLGTDVLATEEQRQAAFGALDGRLGPQR